MRSTGERLALAALVVLLAVGGWLASAPRAREASDISSTYSADPMGVKAFYTLLGERLGYTARRLRVDYTNIPKDAAVLVVVQPLASEPILPNEVRALEAWVRCGGVVVFASDKLRSVPHAFRQSRKLQNGRVYAFDTRSIFTNQGIRDYRRALTALEPIALHARPSDVVMFDEYHHGLGEGDRTLFALMGRQVKTALVILFAAGLVLCFSRARRFGEVRPLAESAAPRPGVEYVESIARLYQRANATDLAVEILGSSFMRRANSKLGLQPEEHRSRVEQAAASVVTEKAAAALERVLDRCGTPGSVSEAELQRFASDIHLIEQELGIAQLEH